MQFATLQMVYFAYQSQGIVCMDGIAAGIQTLGLSQMDLAIRYMLVGHHEL